MNLNKSTRYALYATFEMARAGEESQVTVAQVARRYRIPEGALAKVFQRLVRSGVATGTRGVGGGYRLARKSSELTVLDVVSVFEVPRTGDQCLISGPTIPRCEDYELCRLRRLFDEVDEMVRCTFASVTLDTLVGKRAGGPPDLDALSAGG